jgi:hypothetical protein
MLWRIRADRIVWECTADGTVLENGQPADGDLIALAVKFAADEGGMIQVGPGLWTVASDPVALFYAFYDLATLIFPATATVEVAPPMPPGDVAPTRPPSAPPTPRPVTGPGIEPEFDGVRIVAVVDQMVADGSLTADQADAILTELGGE